MAEDVAHKKWWQIFEVVFGVPFLAALGMQRVLPVNFPSGIFVPARIFAGILLIITGLTLVVLARREFIGHNQPTDPGFPTSTIITTGVFSISRNPFYLGGVILLAGISLAFDLPWVLILLLPALIACHYILIAPEERYLTARFGETYLAYATTVHRWLGRKRRWG